MLFTYKAIDKDGTTKEGTIDARSEDSAITGLQRRGMVIVSIRGKEEEGLFARLSKISFGARVPTRDIVILSRQIATLFEAQVSPLRVFQLLGSEAENKILQDILTTVADDIQGGMPLHKALSKHDDVFSNFYVNMVRAGEESGKLNETFQYLADYLDRSYELTSKTKNALIYPAFVITTFVVVMILMLTVVIPRLSAILIETGQEVPIYTKVVIGMSNFLTSYGMFILLVLAGAGIFLWRYVQTQSGQNATAQLRLNTPYIGELYQKLYLSRIADNMQTMISSGISMVYALEITGTVVGNRVYEQALADVTEQVRGGTALSEALSQYSDIIPPIMTQMVRIGEETGNLEQILKTLALFYKREVDNTVDTLVGLIEPIMIVALGLGVGILLTSVLVPIYNITSSI